MLYSVPVRVDTWRELVRCMEEEICELERKLKKRKQGAAETEDDGLEVAPAKAAPSKDREAPKRKAGKTAKAETDPAKADLALAKNKQKTEKANQRAADLAARTLSVVTNFLKMSPVLETQLRGFKFLEEAETLQAARAEASAWRKASSDLLALHENSKGTGVPLQELGYTTPDLKERQKLWADLMKSSRQTLKTAKAAQKVEAAQAKAAQAGA